jgi:hypothetical protein
MYFLKLYDGKVKDPQDVSGEGLLATSQHGREHHMARQYV